MVTFTRYDLYLLFPVTSNLHFSQRSVLIQLPFIT
nr:MAG TPA: hypothetical protein [Caudoviricetes sp.]